MQLGSIRDLYKFEEFCLHNIYMNKLLPSTFTKTIIKKGSNLTLYIISHIIRTVNVNDSEDGYSKMFFIRTRMQTLPLRNIYNK